MIPISLTLTNFLSYRDTAELDLRGVHLACISGLNGAGKSSLLDAMIWALFGKSRASDDDVVNRTAANNGQAAEVTFVFELEGVVYRITRRKAQRKTTELELYLLGEDAEGQPRWRVMTATKVAESQKAIRALLRMDYDVFTNASFLLQGKADEFTTKTPDRRKEILADILGVQQWDEYKALATDRRKAAETDLRLLHRQLEDIDAELAEEDERRQALELAEARETAVTAQQVAQEAVVTTLRQNQALIEQQHQLLKRMVTDLDAAQNELQRVERDSARRRAELEAHRAVLDRRADIEAIFNRWQTAEADFVRWQERADQFAAIQRELHPLEMAVANARTRLEGRQHELENQSRNAQAAALECDALTAKLAGERKRLSRLAARAAEAAEQERAWHEARANLMQLESERRLWLQQHDQLAAEAAQAARQDEDRGMTQESLKVARERLAKATAELAQLDEQQQQVADARADLAALEVELSALEKAGREKRALVEALESEDSQDCPLCHQPLTADHRQNSLRELNEEVTALRADYQARQARQRTLNQLIKDSSASAGRRPQVEKERDTQQGAVGRHEARLHDLEEALRNWNGAEGATRLAELKAALAGNGDVAQMQQQIDALRSAVEQSKSLTREQQILTNEIARSEARHEQLQRAVSQWEESGRPELESLGHQLATSDYAQTERAALAAVEARLEAVAYDAAAHSAARALRAELAGTQDAMQQLRQAEAAVKPLADALEDLNGRGQGAAARVADLRGQRERQEQTLRDMQAGAGDLRAAEAEHERLREEQTAVIRATANARQKVEVLKELRREAKRIRGQKTTLSARLAMLRQLEEACGRKGVQALLIDQALPEIEDHANELLYRLSGGEMNVLIKPTRKGKTTNEEIETLDIIIADREGARPYENYSGGEKFRVNFAIRLALSQVLAQRAGARLRTLVIDEGFGSQDPEGRQRLVEAINAVQSEFACILVITHIDELRDKFPARIEVEKVAAGSRLTLVAN